MEFFDLATLNEDVPEGVVRGEEESQGERESVCAARERARLLSGCPLSFSRTEAAAHPRP